MTGVVLRSLGSTMLQANIPGLIILKERKKYGTRRKVEGPIDRIAVVKLHCGKHSRRSLTPVPLGLRCWYTAWMRFSGSRVDLSVKLSFPCLVDERSSLSSCLRWECFFSMRQILRSFARWAGI